MLLVQPTGQTPSRPASRSLNPDPAEPGFSAIALLAAAQLPNPVRPEPAPETDAPAASEPKEASLSQSGEPPRAQNPELERTSDASAQKDAPAAASPADSAQPDGPLPTLPEASAPMASVGAPLPAAAAAILPTLPPAAPAAVPPSFETMTAAKVAAPILPPAPERPSPAGVLVQEPAAAGFSATPVEPLPGPQASAAAQSAPALAALPTGVRPAKAAPLRNGSALQAEAPLHFDPSEEAPEPVSVAPPTLRLPARAQALPDPAAAMTSGAKAIPAEGPQLGPPLLPVPTRLGVPAGPARSSEVESPVKESARAAAPQRPTDEAQPQRTDTARPAAESAAPHPPAAHTESGPALPRSESLGMQPSTVPSAAPASPAATVASRAEVAPTWQVPVPPVLQQVENGIRWMLRNASPGAELQLHPEALGMVRIELKVEGGDVHARLWASDPKSIPVLQENKAFLEVSLKEQGLNLGSFDLRQNANQPQQGFTEGQSRGQFWPTEAGPAEPGQDAPSRPAPRNPNPRRIELIA